MFLQFHVSVFDCFLIHLRQGFSYHGNFKVVPFRYNGICRNEFGVVPHMCGTSSGVVPFLGGCGRVFLR